MSGRSCLLSWSRICLLESCWSIQARKYHGPSRQMKMFGDVSVNYFGAGSKLGSTGAVSLTVKSIDMGDIPITTVETMDGTGSTFTPTTTMALTYANAFSDKARFGVSVKSIAESIPRASASALALDAGVQYENLNDIQGLGIALALKT